MTPIEKAARALCKAAGKDDMLSMDGAPLWRAYLPQVMTVIHAIHEPSSYMMEAGAEVIRYVSPDETEFGHQNDATNVWRFMIDAMHKDSISA